MSSTTKYETELKTLYARRHALDELIRSLEDYCRYREQRSDERRRKTA